MKFRGPVTGASDILEVGALGSIVCALNLVMIYTLGDPYADITRSEGSHLAGTLRTGLEPAAEQVEQLRQLGYEPLPEGQPEYV